MPETPEHYKRAIEKWGGLNPLGEPNFILQWGEAPVRRLAVPDEFLGQYLNCWVLAEWEPPETFGSPDELADLGIPFPNRGAYLPLWVYRQDGEPVMLDSEFLNLNVLRLQLHVVMTHKHDSLQKRYHFLKDEFAKRKAEEARLLIDRIEDGAPVFVDAVSFRNQLNCNSVIRQKVDILEKNLDRIRASAAKFPRGGIVQRSVSA